LGGICFQLGSMSKAYRSVDRHTRNRLRRWLCRKHKVKVKRRNRFDDEYFHAKLGLVRLARSKTNLPWAKPKESLSESRCAKSARPV
jgi:RNA-directed DNA polymerase